MHKLILFFSVNLFCLISVSQEQYPREIETISNALHKQLVSQNVKSRLGADSIDYKVALVGIETEDGKTTKLTQLIEAELAINLAAESLSQYRVLDRNYINKLLKEKNIPKDHGNKKDFAKNLGRVKAAQIMVVGRLDNFDNQFRLLFTILETSEGETLTGARGYLTATTFIKEKNQEMVRPDLIAVNENDRANNQATNTSVNKKPDDMDPDCESKNIGSILIINNTSHKVNVSVTDRSRQEAFGPASVGYLTIGPKESDKLLGITPGTFDYRVQLMYEDGRHDDNYRNSTVRVSKCTEAKITIR